MAIKLVPGLYESLINRLIEAGIADAAQANLRADRQPLDEGDSHTYFAQYLAERIRHAFSSLPHQDRLEKQVQLANAIVLLLSEHTDDALNLDESLINSAELLLSLNQPSLIPKLLERADTPLSASCLMTGTRQDPTLVSQLRKEIATADRVDILCSFIKWGGVRIMEDAFRRHTREKPLRLITTSYMGATDLKAVEFLRELPNTELRVSYDTRRTRLHAKAYIIHRDSGFGVAYIGSSNLSNAALTDGLEWNVKISQHESPHLWRKICATFDTYWNDNEFVPYSADSTNRLRDALQGERGANRDDGIIQFFNLNPFPFQQEILDRLAAERQLHNRFRNLVVAATGTGKTVISAFDYLRFRKEQGEDKPNRLLFIAHREEILKQSLYTFQSVLRDPNFGQLLVGGHEQDNLDHLFCSIQMFKSRQFTELVSPQFYDYVVVDEFHHAAADSYQPLLNFVKPKVLLGLTATPERMDGVDVTEYFDNHIAAEIRLPDAINRKLLCPFQYFGITDVVDFSEVRWRRGGYDVSVLSNLLTGDDVRARLIVKRASEIVLNIHRARGLGFCVSIEHAEYMAKSFNVAGIPAEALSANTPGELRKTAKRRLAARELNFIFVVDLYNEGIDIPEIDTILLLRPTESLTVFLQQLGRGLRLHHEKECLTVLDFIGQAHENFNFEARFRALAGQTSKRIDAELSDGFPHLPAGCVISLERVATKYVLDNIHQAITQSSKRLVHRIAKFSSETGREITLGNFLDYHRLSVEDVYRRNSWSRLLVEANLRPDFTEPDESRLHKAFRRMSHINDYDRMKTLLEILSGRVNGEVYGSDERQARYLSMLHFTLWTPKLAPKSIREGLERLSKSPTMANELNELLRARLNVLDEVPEELSLPFLCPLQLHADYTRDEILTALGVWTLESQPELREGVLYVKPIKADLLFVTLNKTEDAYSPTTMYDDYAISDRLFHWQSQSTTSAESATGKRYINHRENFHTVLLFVREDKKRNQIAQPYTFLGPVDYAGHTGSRPMSITWELRHKLPAKLIPTIRRLANA